MENEGFRRLPIEIAAAAAAAAAAADSQTADKATEITRQSLGEMFHRLLRSMSTWCQWKTPVEGAAMGVASLIT